MDNIIYIAVNKKTGKVMVGAKGQYAFGDVATLGRSVGQNYRYEAKQAGIKPKEMYSVHEIDVNMILPKEDN